MSYLVRGSVGGLPKQRPVFPFPDDDAHDGVLHVLVLVVEELDQDKGLGGAAPGLPAVHARAFLCIPFTFVLEASVGAVEIKDKRAMHTSVMSTAATAVIVDSSSRPTARGQSFMLPCALRPAGGAPEGSESRSARRTGTGDATAGGGKQEASDGVHLSTTRKVEGGSTIALRRQSRFPNSALRRWWPKRRPGRCGAGWKPTLLSSSRPSCQPNTCPRRQRSLVGGVRSAIQSS